MDRDRRDAVTAHPLPDRAPRRQVPSWASTLPSARHAAALGRRLVDGWLGRSWRLPIVGARRQLMNNPRQNRYARQMGRHRAAAETRPAPPKSHAELLADRPGIGSSHAGTDPTATLAHRAKHRTAGHTVPEHVDEASRAGRDDRVLTESDPIRSAAPATDNDRASRPHVRHDSAAQTSTWWIGDRELTHDEVVARGLGPFDV
jgi:hypothetical protein